MLRVTEPEVRRLLPFSKAVQLVHEAYTRLARGEATNPPRVWLSVPGGASMFFMPGHVYGQRTVSIKVARVNSTNPSLSLPTVMLTVYVYDATSGVQLAEVDGEWLTAVRTAASTAVATDILAKETVRTLGIFGSGMQAKAHVPALMSIRSFQKVLVYSRDKGRRESFARSISHDYGIKTEATDSPHPVANEADVIVTATTSNTPVLDGGLVRTGALVNAIGSADAGAREVDTALVKRSRVVVDSRAQALATYGDVVIPIREGEISDSEIIELGDLLVRKTTMGPSDVTLFKAGGLAVLDAMVTDYIIDCLSRQSDSIGGDRR